MSRQIDYESLKNQNFQLKNQITDLKNGFDLNRDVLKILQQTSKQSNPSSQIFYQIISRLTGINNQIMLANVEMVQERAKWMNENSKLKMTLQGIQERMQEMTNSKDVVNPQEVHIQMREQMKGLRAEIYSLHEEVMRKNYQILRLQTIIQEKQYQEQKKPIIPSVIEPCKSERKKSDIQNVPKTYESNEEVRYIVLNKKLERENNRLKLLVDELEYRLTLMSSVYKMESFQQRETSRQRQISKQQQFYKKLTESQLQLLMFAFQNLQYVQNEQAQNNGLKVTITKRCKAFLSNNSHLKNASRPSSCPKTQSLNLVKF